MHDVTKKKRVWGALVCPVCRLVFRVPRDHDGKAVVCPSCQYLLNIPSQENKAPITVTPALRDKKPHARTANNPHTTKPIVSHTPTPTEIIPAPVRAPEPELVKRRKKKKQKVTPDWESETPRANSKSEAPTKSFFIGSLIALAFAVTGAWMAISISGKSKASRSQTASELFSDTDLYSSPDDADPSSEKERKIKKEIFKSIKSGVGALADAETTVANFLNAKTASELEKYVRTPEITVPRMRKWYSNHSWEKPGVIDIGFNGKVTVMGSMVSMAVRLSDHSVKQIALENSQKGYLVDWESWVVWSSMDWQELLEKRPTQLVELRAKCTLSNYYNRQFNDDSKWIAVKMQHPDEDKVIYGYIDIEAPELAQMIKDLRSRGVVPATVEIHYPENAKANNQVFISQYLQNGWVRRTTGETPSQKKSP